jgi:hypothetical protein
MPIEAGAGRWSPGNPPGCQSNRPRGGFHQTDHRTWSPWQRRGDHRGRHPDWCRRNPRCCVTGGGHVQSILPPAGIAAAMVQIGRSRAASLARLIRSRSIAYSLSAARSAAATKPCVGETQAVGQRVIPLVRINSATAVSLWPSETTRSVLVSIRWLDCNMLHHFVTIRYVFVTTFIEVKVKVKRTSKGRRKDRLSRIVHKPYIFAICFSKYD